MAVGATVQQYLDQDAPAFDLRPNNSYARLKLYDVQAYFSAGWLQRPATLIVHSEVETSLQAGARLRSLHQLAMVHANTPLRVAIDVNLTDWLPAHSRATVSLALNLTVVQDRPFAELLDRLNQLKLVATVSTFAPDWAVALRVSEICGRLLSLALKEGAERQVLPLLLDLNLVGDEARAGLYAAVGSTEELALPRVLRYTRGPGLTDKHGSPLTGCSYAVLALQALPRLGAEAARDEPWWALLEAARGQIVDGYIAGEAERRKAVAAWAAALRQARALAAKSRSYLGAEIDELFHAAQADVGPILSPASAPESFGTGALPAEWQQLLGVASLDALDASVRDYRDALTLAADLKRQYARDEASDDG